MSKYTFKTIVATESVRADFTALRDSLGTSDKELMQAFWNLVNQDGDALKAEVVRLQEASALDKAAKKEVKAAAKQKDAPVAKRERKAKETVESEDTAPVAKRQRKAKATVTPVASENERVNEIESIDGDAPVMVVVG